MEVIRDMERTIRRGDIYYEELDTVVGSEQVGIRLVLIISNNIGNRHSPHYRCHYEPSADKIKIADTYRSK